MTHWNVHIYAFDDAGMLQKAVETLPSGVPVHVFDGRYQTFPGEGNLSPSIEEFCEAHPDCLYYEPPADILPFGDPSTPAEWRSAVHEKAAWAFKHLPESEWTLKLDTDERLVEFDASALSDLKESGKHCPVINMANDPLGEVHIARLFKPQYWTPWINDCILPRDIIPRHTSLERLHTAWFDYHTLRFHDRYDTDAIYIDNVGASRDEEYLERRWAHLRNIGRDDRADDVKSLMDNDPEH